MTLYLPSLDINTLNGSNGITFHGEPVQGNAGFKVVQGDINGDGFADFVIAAPSQQKVYVVFGKSSGIPDVDLGNLSGSDGFSIDGRYENDEYNYYGNYFATDVAVGDFNFDGIADTFIGSTNGESGGGVYVISGRSQWSSNSGQFSIFDFTSDEIISIVSAEPGFGGHVSYNPPSSGVDLAPSAPVIIDATVTVSKDGGGVTYHLENDGKTLSADDYTSSAPGNGLGSGLGSGRPGPSQTGQEGGQRVQAADSSPIGPSFSGCDFNGDGYLDVVCTDPAADVGSATDCGLAYVIFGGPLGLPPSFDVTDCDGSNGVCVSGATDGEQVGTSYCTGDINGDGKSDLILGANNAVYIVFGSATNFGTAGIDLGALDGKTGFRIVSPDVTSGFGQSVGFVGDTNGDGFGDFGVGAPCENKEAGAAYVYFGAAKFNSGQFNANTLADGDRGYKATGAAAGDRLGTAVDPGDFNGDGFADVGLGAPSANGGDGEAYIIFGGKPGEAVTRTGTAIAQTIQGGDINDNLKGASGNDILIGHGGADDLDGGNGLDVASYRTKTQSIVVTLNGGTAVAVSVGGVVEDSVHNIEGMIGGSAADTLIGDGFDNWFRGGGGNDTFDGSGGSDTADFSEKTGKLFVSLAGASNVVGKIGNINEDTLRNVENIIGTKLDDFISGDDSVNIFRGAGGNDTLYGGLAGTSSSVMEVMTHSASARVTALTFLMGEQVPIPRISKDCSTRFSLYP